MDLGTDLPWIPEDLVVEAQGWNDIDGYHNFYAQGETLFHIRNDQVISVTKVPQ